MSENTKINTKQVTIVLAITACILAIFGGIFLKNQYINFSKIKSLSSCLEYSEYCTTQQYKNYQEEVKKNLEVLENEKKQITK